MLQISQALPDCFKQTNLLKKEGRRENKNQKKKKKEKEEE